MIAGLGILHSEFNPSNTEPVHLYQVWLFPRAKGLTPTYQQTAFSEGSGRDVSNLSLRRTEPRVRCRASRVPGCI